MLMCLSLVIPLFFLSFPRFFLGFPQALAKNDNIKSRSALWVYLCNKDVSFITPKL
jgi:hypothetical protein